MRIILTNSYFIFSTFLFYIDFIPILFFPLLLYSDFMITHIVCFYIYLRLNILLYSFIHLNFSAVQGLAKMRLSEIVLPSDVEEAIRLMKVSMHIVDVTIKQEYHISYLKWPLKTVYTK